MLQIPEPTTFVITDMVNVAQRVNQLREWHQLWLKEDKKLEDQLKSLNMNNPIDVQKGAQISIMRRRLRLIQVKEPLEISLDAIIKIGFDNFRKNLVQQFAQMSKAEKLLWMRNFLFIMTPDLRDLCDKISTIRGYRALGQQRNFLLGGDSGMGKTTFLDWYASRYMATVEEGYNHIPIIKIDAPVANSPKPLLQRLILECGTNYLRGDTEENLLMKLAFYFQKCLVEMLIIDEIEHIKRSEIRRRVLEISNLTRGVPIICASCHPLHFRDGDSEVAGRWNDLLYLRPFKGTQLRQLLAYIELLLPFPEPSFLPEDEVAIDKHKKVQGPAKFIEEKTGGVLRDIMVLLYDASRRAIEASHSHLTLELLKKTWDDIQNKPPSEHI